MAPRPAKVDIAAFATTQLALLEAELNSELEETSLLLSNSTPTALARAGLAIVNLTLTSLRTGLGGKIVVELGVDSAVSSKEKGGGGEGELGEHGEFVFLCLFVLGGMVGELMR
jgi:DNA polymerase alpha-associated DNA helicase A